MNFRNLSKYRDKDKKSKRDTTFVELNSLQFLHPFVLFCFLFNILLYNSLNQGVAIGYFETIMIRDPYTSSYILCKVYYKNNSVVVSKLFVEQKEYTQKVI